MAANYLNSAAGSASYTIKVTPVLTWAAPAAITYGGADRGRHHRIAEPFVPLLMISGLAAICCGELVLRGTRAPQRRKMGHEAGLEAAGCENSAEPCCKPLQRRR